MKKISFKRIGKSVVLALSVTGASIASAAETTPSLDSLWNTISFASVTSAVFGIGALIITLDLAQIGYFRVRGLIKGAKST